MAKQRSTQAPSAPAAAPDALAALDTSPLIGWPLGLYVADETGRLLFANPMLRELLGLPERGGIEGSVSDFIADASWKELVASAEGPRRSGQKRVLTLAVDGPEGRTERTVEH